VGGTGRNAIAEAAEALGIQGEAEGSLDAGAESLSVAESDDTGIVDLGLDESGRVKVATELVQDTASR
jgi:hypothetical protein